MAYTCALQNWAEKTDPPAGGRPRLLAESVRELREELGSYLHFSDKEVFRGLALPEEMSLKEATPQSTSTGVVDEGTGAKVTGEPAGERRAPKFLGWEKILHPSRPVVATAEVPCLSRGPRAKGRGNSMDPMCQIVQDPGHSTKYPYPTETILASMRIGGCLTDNASMWLSRGDGLPEER